MVTIARYPKARYREVSGLSKDPPIIPIGVILHVRAGEGSSLFDYFNGPSKGIESHFYLTYDGKWEQYRDTGREADANYKGNSFVINGKRYGFLSIETEGLASGKWTAIQLSELKQFLLWANKTHGIPLRVCPAWNKAGIGYHVMFGAPGPWTPHAKICPGTERVKQFNSLIVPWMKNPTQGEKPVPTSSVWDEDKIPAPKRTNTKANPTWTAGLFLHYVGEWVLQLRDQLAVVVNGQASQAATLARIEAKVNAISEDAAVKVAAAVKAELADLEITLTTKKG